MADWSEVNSDSELASELERQIGINMAGVAQLVRAPDCGSGGRGFEPHHSPHIT